MLNKRIKAAIAAVTIVGATSAAMLVPASPAVAFSSGGLVLDVLVQSPAHLIANGAAIAVPIEYTCSGASFTQLTVTVTERVSRGAIASGNVGISNLNCSGEIQKVTFNIAATSDRAFTKGIAFAGADIFGCSGFCADQANSRTITIQR